MVDYKINNLRQRVTAINNEQKDGRYNTEDISRAEHEYIKRHAPQARSQRADLSKGDLVVVLEGAYMSRRGVFLKQLPGNKAILFVLNKENSPVLFKIDERYLFKLSAHMDMPFDITVNPDLLIESARGESERMDVEGGDSDVSLSRSIMSEVSKVKFMKTYLSSDFVIDHSVEFYSQQY